MTHLPLEDRKNVWGVPGPKYEPAPMCSHPFCDPPYYQLERHHLWPRSFLRNQPTDWVKLPDGKIVQNCVYLCREHHQQITENKAKILYGTEQGFYWKEPTTGGWAVENLSTQPRFLDSDDAWVIPDGAEALESFTEPHSDVPEGTECPKCHRRVPRKRKKTTPESKVISFRLPIDNADAWEEIIEAAANHLNVKAEAYWKWQTLEKALVIVLQGPGG